MYSIGAREDDDDNERTIRRVRRAKRSKSDSQGIDTDLVIKHMAKQSLSKLCKCEDFVRGPFCRYRFQVCFLGVL